MKLIRAMIRNFRSIEKLDIHFNDGLQILVGINESGKSNVLKALSFLDRETPINSEDIRQEAPDEETPQESIVRFVFEFEKQEIENLVDDIFEVTLAPNLDTWVCQVGDRKLTFKELAQLFDGGTYRIDLIDQHKSFRYWAHNKSYKINERWKVVHSNCPEDYHIETTDGYLPLRDFWIVDTEEFDEIPKQYLRDLTTEDVIQRMGSAAIDIVDTNLPKCILWEYSQDNLLPSKMAISEFAANPDSCKPLKHMFELAEISDIKGAFDAAQTKNRGVRNLLSKVADRATKHLKGIWKEYKDIKIELYENGSYIEPSIRDKYNVFEFSKRSDGFKRFITFLLIISTRVRTSDLRHELILIDEPEIGLHPSGIKYLREELKRVSKENYIVYSTHSIFMIDRENPQRHYIVKKSNEKTTVEKVNESNIYDEEVIYNAMGYSIFENLSMYNIVFEGWRDKLLFKVATKTLPKELGTCKKTLEATSLCHANGVKSIKSITPLIELSKRHCIILSDNDSVAQQHKAQYDGYGSWYTYSDVSKMCGAVTGEDFIKGDVIIRAIRGLSKKYRIQAPDQSFFDNSGNNKIEQIKRWLKSNGKSKQEIQKFVTDLKRDLFENLKKSHIEQTYYAYLKNVSALLSSL